MSLSSHQRNPSCLQEDELAAKLKKRTAAVESSLAEAKAQDDLPEVDVNLPFGCPLAASSSHSRWPRCSFVLPLFVPSSFKS